MPTYQYACTDCAERIEAVQKFTDEPLTVCSLCGGRLRKVFSPVGIVFKGSGFYRNDSQGQRQEGKGAERISQLIPVRARLARRGLVRLVRFAGRGEERGEGRRIVRQRQVRRKEVRQVVVRFRFLLVVLGLVGSSGSGSSSSSGSGSSSSSPGSSSKSASSSGSKVA